MSEQKWWSVTFRGPAEMVVWVQAETMAGARQAAEDGEYEDMTNVEFLHSKPQSMKTRLADGYKPPER